MREAFVIVAVILFIIDALLWWSPSTPWGGRLIPVGLVGFRYRFRPTLTRAGLPGESALILGSNRASVNEP